MYAFFTFTTTITYESNEVKGFIYNDSVVPAGD